MRYFMVEIRETFGSREHNQIVRIKAENIISARAIQDYWLARWYTCEGDVPVEPDDYGQYFHEGGEILCTAGFIHEIQETTFNDLNTSIADMSR